MFFVEIGFSIFQQIHEGQEDWFQKLMVWSSWGKGCAPSNLLPIHKINLAPHTRTLKVLQSPSQSGSQNTDLVSKTC